MKMAQEENYQWCYQQVSTMSTGNGAKVTYLCLVSTDYTISLTILACKHSWHSSCHLPFFAIVMDNELVIRYCV